jgi:hypothetical protein
MPKLVRLYIHCVAVGFAISTAFTTALMWLDVAGLGHLISTSESGGVAVAMLVVFNGIVFSAVQFAFRVMAMAEPEDRPRGGRGAREMVPVRVTAPSARRNNRR